jgi:hypothetical protein
MSDAPVETVLPPEERRPLTPEASNILGWWWLAIGFSVLLLWAMWPSIFTDSASSFGTYLGVVITIAFVALGAWAAAGFTRAEPWSVGVMRMTAIIGMVVGLLAVAYFLYAVAFTGPAKSSLPGSQTAGFFGPEGSFLGGFLWVTIIILPFIFGLMIIFGLMSEGAEHWMNPPPPESPTAPNLRIDPATAAMLAGSAGAVSHGVSDEALMTELSQVMTVNQATLRRPGDEQSVEVVGTAGDDLSVEVVGGDVTQDEGSLAELAALEQALSEDAAKKKKAKKQKKEEKKKKATSGDEPLSVDDDFKL